MHPALFLLAARCTLPTLTDGYVGFTVGQPPGWTLDYERGVIQVKRESGATVAIVFPIDRGARAQDVLAEYARSLQDAARSRGDIVRVTGGEISGSIGGTPIRGRLAAGKGLIHGGWAPAEAWERERATIDAVAACYEPARGTALAQGSRTGSDGAGSTTWRYVLPEGWRIAGATSRGVDVMLDERNGVSFGYLTGMFGSQTPDGFASFVLSSAGHHDVKWVASRDMGTRSDAIGNRWTMKTVEYLADANGHRIRVVLTVGVSNSFGSWSAMAALRMADVRRWDGLAAVTAVVQESIRILDAKPGKGLRLPANRPNDVELPSRDASVDDRLSAEWEAAILGFDETRSPTTGETFLMPLGAWNETGADGPGYYRPLPGGSRERLEVEK